MLNSEGWNFVASRVTRLSLMVSMTWKGKLTRGTSLRVPSSLYFPGQTSSVLVISILAIILLLLPAIPGHPTREIQAKQHSPVSMDVRTASLFVLERDPTAIAMVTEALLVWL